MFGNVLDRRTFKSQPICASGTLRVVSLGSLLLTWSAPIPESYYFLKSFPSM